MLASLIAAFKLPDLRKRILFVFGMFAIYVFGLHIMVPGVDHVKMNHLFESGGAFGMIDLFSGGAFKRYTVFAMGIAPYINASIIMQLLTVAIPSLEALAKEGEHGRKVISQYTRYLTVILAFVQALATNKFLAAQDILNVSVLGSIEIIVTLAAGTAFLMWMGEQITDKGVGNGVSLVIFAGIVAMLPTQITQTWELAVKGNHIGGAIALLVLFLGTIVGIVAIQQAQRKIPIQHVKRVVGNKVYSGSSSFLPLRVNSAGVIPIIFAISIQLFPATISSVLGKATPARAAFARFVEFIQPGSVLGAIIYTLMIIAFTYFYTAITFNVPEVADNLKKYGSFIPGIRPGKPTLEYLDRVMSRITLAGAIFLSVIALMQYIAPELTGIRTFSLAGGTSLLILVGVALETMQAIEAHLLMRHYEGFIK